MVEKRSPAGQVTSPDSSGWGAPQFDTGMTFREVGSGGLRQFSGWVREEFLQQLVGRQAIKTYREMLDNSSAVGGAMLAISGAMRKVPWRTDPADDTPKAQEAADFAESLRFDMSHTWEDFIAEALSMLGYGFAPHEIVYKKRKGRTPGGDLPKSDYEDGLIGIRKFPLRGQDTILKWFFGDNGEILGLTQQPWRGPIIDIPIEKLLLFRPSQHKNNPEGRSILRNCYRNYFFVKRLEEQEEILFERFSGLPVLKVPTTILEAAASGDENAVATLNAYKKLISNVRIDEQMGVLLPSDHYMTGAGAGAPMYDFQLVTPQGGRQNLSADVSITRHKLDIATSMLADFIVMGHDARGAQNLGETKLDMFMQAVEGYLNSIGAVLNRRCLPRVWSLNGLDFNLMPQWVPDTAQRLDLDVLSQFILRLSQAGMPMFPDQELESYIRDAAGMPDIEDGNAAAALVAAQTEQQIAEAIAAREAAPQGVPVAAAVGGKTPGSGASDPQSKLHKVIKASFARRARRMGAFNG